LFLFTMVATLRLALRMLRRDLRAGELTLLGIALALAVASLSSVAFLTERVEQGLRQQSHQLLGGDLLLTADHPWPQAQRDKAAEFGVKLAESITFPSMVSSESSAQLADIKAVSTNYPLRGALRVTARNETTAGKTDREIRSVPAKGNVWVDERLLSALGVKIGDTVGVGKLKFAVTEVLTVEPDKGFNVFNLAPRLMMNVDDLAATGLLQQGSRAQWRLQLAGNASAIERYQQWAKAGLGRGEKVENLDNARPEVKVLLDRAQRFFSLAAMLAVVLAAVAITLTVNRYVQHHLDGCAVMRCLGASSRTVLGVHLGEFFMFGLFATLLGCLVGFVIQQALVMRLAGLIGPVGADLPAPSWRPWALGLGVGLLIMVGSVLPPLLRLRHVPAISVLRREWNSHSSWRVWLAGGIALALLMVWIAGDLKLGAIVIGGFAAIGGLYAGLTLLLLGILRRLAQNGGSKLGWPGLHRGLAGLYRRRQSTLIQAVSLAIGLTTLLLLTAGRADLLAAWKHRIPPDAPNRFVINIQPDQRDAVNAFFRGQQLVATLEPMIRARLVAINGRPITAESFADDQAKRLVEREFNLSWSTQLPPGNVLTDGQWRMDSATPQFSVEQGLAENLGLKLGDELSYDIAGSKVAARITSLRRLEWDSMRVNFFVVGSPTLLASQPASYITSFHLDAGKEEIVTEMIRAFPNLTVIDVGSLVRQLEAATDQAARAVEAVFGFALIAGIIVLVAVFNTTHDERIREMAILRALGARRQQLLVSLLTESVALGSLAGLLAGVGAGGFGFALARWVFHLPYTPGPALIGIALVAGIVLAGISGYLGLRSVANVSPVRVLANGFV
jgi:putative ABC transport system permease protein